MSNFKKGTTYLVKCRTCGKEFSYVFQGSRRYVCDKCSFTKELMKTHPFKGMGAEKRKKKTPHLTEINAAARAAGMSYGQYQAYLYFQRLKEVK